MKTNAIAQVPRARLEQMAMNMRRKARNAAVRNERMASRAVNVGFGMAASYGAGYLLGMREQKGEPTEIGGVDYELAVGLSMFATALVLGRGGKTSKAADLLEAGGTGVLAFWAGNYGLDHGKSHTSVGPVKPSGPPTPSL